jgi:hypothetical protein
LRLHKKAQHLKTIDVLCLDPDGSVKKRFDELISFKDYRFRSYNVEAYLEYNFQKNRVRKSSSSSSNHTLSFNCLEEAHKEFFDNKG